MIVPANFGGLWTSLDHPINEFSNLSASSFSRAEFFLSPDEPTFSKLSTSDQPVSRLLMS